VRTYRFLALIATAATYALIFIGGLVRVSGAGLGCPDWPKCFGGWIPPVSAEGLPDYIDPARFNFTLAWIEYGNRLVGVLVGLLILATALLAIRYYRQQPKVLIPSLIAAVLVAFQGWLGGVVVAMELKPVLVSAHLVLAFSTVLLLIYALLQSFYTDRTLKTEAVYPSQAKWLLIGLGILTFAQILLGAQVRGQLEILADAFPLLPDSAWLARVGFIQDLHMIVGIFTVLYALLAGFFILRLSEKPTRVAQRAIWLMVLLALAQLALGLTFLVFGLLPILQLFHLWFASLLLGVILVALETVISPFALPEDVQQGIGKAVAAGVVLTLLLTAVAFVVIKEAELSRTDIPVYTKLPEFTLLSADGETVTDSAMVGKVSLVAFMCTECDPRSAGAMVRFAELHDRYEHSDRVQFVVITTDPDHDSPDLLRHFSEELGVDSDRWTALWGQPETVRLLVEEGFHLSWDPGVDTRSNFVLVDQAGRVRGFYEYDNDDVLALLEEHVRYLVRP